MKREREKTHSRVCARVHAYARPPARSVTLGKKACKVNKSTQN